MNIDEKFMRKNGIVIRKLAREMMTREVNDRIPTISEYVDSYNVSKGTVQGALTYLSERAMSLEKMGHMGSYVANIDYKKMWEYTGWNAIVALSPLPLNNRLRSMSTAITILFERAKIPFLMAFMQSASNRISALEESRFDLIITSHLTSETYLKEERKLKSVFELEDFSYSKANILAFTDPMQSEIKDGMIIAYDPLSLDQALLTKQLCKDKKVTFKTMPYRSTFQSLIAGNVDAIVYQSESIFKADRKLGYAELSNMKSSNKATKASVIVHKNNYWIDELIQNVLDASEISTIQNEVEQGIRPSYY